MMTALFAAFRLLPGGMQLGLVGMVLVGTLSGYGHLKSWWTVRGLNQTIATQAQSLKDKDAEIASYVAQTAKLETAIAEQNLNLTNLRDTIRQQSEQVAAFALKAQASDAKAALSALDALRAGEQAAAAIRANTDRPSGAASMNQWLAERFK